MRKILITGGAVLDLVAGPLDAAVFTIPSTMTDHIQMSTGGNGLNEAIAASMIHPYICLATTIGSDLAGHTLRQAVKSRQIELIESGIEADTSINVLLNDASGERYIVSKPDTSLRKVILPSPETLDADIVSLADLFASPLITLEQLEEWMRQWKGKGAVTFLDMARPKHQETAMDLKKILSNVDYFTCNQFEASALTQKKNPAAAAKEILFCGANRVLLKLGKDGVLYAGKNPGPSGIQIDQYLFWYPAVANPDCVDATGCGDNFAGIFLACLAQEFPFEQALAMAMAAGSIACTKAGAVTAIQSTSLADLEENARAVRKNWSCFSQDDFWQKFEREE